MNDNQNWSNTGEQFKGALSEALQTGDFKDLNRLVSQTVTSAINEVGKHISTGNGSLRPNGQNYSQNNTSNAQANASTWQAQAGGRQQAQAQASVSSGYQAQASASAGYQTQANASTWQAQVQAGASAWQQQAQAKLQQKKEQLRLKEEQLRRREALLARRQDTPQSRPPAVVSVKFKKVGNVSNVLYQVFGGIGLGITGLVTLIHLMASFYGDASLDGWIMNFIFLAIFYGMIRLGIAQKRRLRRAARYVQLCDYRVYGEIENLARHTGKSRQFVIKDLERMLALGIFPEGHLDENKTCFMLNDEVYRQYLESERSRRLREDENRKALEQKEAVQQAPPQVSGEQKSELDAMVSEGTECIRKLRDLNDRIPGEVISAKLFHLENLLKDIFDSVKEHPDQMHRMHKLMSYYLPTTLKLVEAYEEFDRVSAPGTDIIEAKAEIENTLDTINQAFTELLNNLFQDAAFDATTDAQVLKTMLANEGLTREMEYVPVGRN